MRKFLPLTLLLLALTGAASAVPTNTGSFTAPLPGTTVWAQPELAGVSVYDDVVPLQSAGGTINATIQRRVARGADGTLTFSWRLNNAADSQVAITGLTMRGFPKGVYDANWRVDGLGTVATSSLSGDGASAYTWTLASPLQPGQGSRFFYLKTSAKSFTQRSATISAFSSLVSTSTVAIPSPVF